MEYPVIDKLYYSVGKEISRRVEDKSRYLEKTQEKLEKLERELELKSQRQINRTEKNRQKELKSLIESYHENIGSLNRLEQLFQQLMYTTSDKYEFPNDIKKGIDELGTLLTEQEINQLRKKASDCIRNANADKREQVIKQSADVKAFLKKSKFGSMQFYLSTPTSSTMELCSFDRALERIKVLKLKDLSAEISFVEYKPVEIHLDSSDELLLSTIERMIKSNKLEKNKRTQAIINNFGSIKEAFKSKAKLQQVVSILSSVIDSLKMDGHIDTSDFSKFLITVEKKYENELYKVNDYLSKFDFDSIKKQIEVIRTKESEDSLKQQKMTQYEQLAYELEQAKSINPVDYKRIEQIREQMRRVAISFSHTDYELENAMTRGTAKYRNEIRDKKILAAAIKMQKAKEAQLDANVRNEIYESIIRELELDGALREDYEFKNGDAYAIPVDIQTLIKRKIAEGKKETHILEEGKQGPVDSVMEQHDDKSAANEAYRQYIKYRASLKNKKHYMTFSEYVHNYYNGVNISEDMVDSELKSSGGFRR